MTTPAPARSFGAAADDYDRLRPGYPADAVRWALGGVDGQRVVDVGAGTGILTRALLAAGHRVTAVEPDPAMLARLTATSAGAHALSGSAEELPLPGGTADAVVAGQAYHWFDHDRAHAEAARVLRPGGVLAPIWNVRDDTVDWVSALTAIADGARGAARDAPGPQSFGPLFGPVARAEFRHTTPHTPGTLVGLMRTRSYYLTATPAVRTRIEADIRDLLTGHPALAGRETFALPYRTLVFRARRTG
jgi:SAM-dependent methyltransferase